MRRREKEHSKRTAVWREIDGSGSYPMEGLCLNCLLHHTLSSSLSVLSLVINKFRNRQSISHFIDLFAGELQSGRETLYFRPGRKGTHKPG